jgi:uncharacterized protein
MTRLVTPRRVRYFVAAAIVVASAALLARGVLWLRHAGRQYEMSMELGQAIIARDHRKVESLLRAGADPNAADMDDSLLLAMSSPRDETLVALLRRHGANPSRSLLSVHDVENARVLLGMGANPNERVGDSGSTPLAEHSIWGNVEIVQFLLDHGGDPTVRDNDGETILERMEYAAGNHPEQTAAYAQVRALLTRALAKRKQRGNPRKSNFPHTQRHL